MMNLWLNRTETTMKNNTKTCKECKYYNTEKKLCVANPPQVIYHDTIQIRNEKGKVTGTLAPNIKNLNPNVHEDRMACRLYDGKG